MEEWFEEDETLYTTYKCDEKLNYKNKKRIL